MPHVDADRRREYYREWKTGPRKRESNRYYDAAKHANKRAAKYGAPGTITTADARAILQGAVCHYCEGTHLLGLDHVIPLHEGGPNTPDNLVAACRSCNSSKFRGDRPGRWSRDRDACADCGTSERPHRAKGLCGRCYEAAKYGTAKRVRRAA